MGRGRGLFPLLFHDFIGGEGAEDEPIALKKSVSALVK